LQVLGQDPAGDAVAANFRVEKELRVHCDLLDLADSDPRAVQDLCLRLLDGGDRPLAAVAATCLGHLARIHRQLDTDAVTAALDRQRGDELVGPRAEDALDDIDLYMGT